MQYVSIDDLKGNEILAVPVLSSSEVILLHVDTILEQEYIDKLRELEISHVYIKRDHEIKEETRHDYKVEETKEKSISIVKSVLERHIYKHGESLKKVGEAAEKILEAVVSEPQVINNITEIRNISTDMYTHCVNVCSLSTILALSLRMSETQVRNVAMGAILHDIGLRYITVPYDDVDESEMNIKDALEYKKHTIYGYTAVQDETWLSEQSKEIILLHHEREDGSGYPFQKGFKKLKPEVKLVSVCDDFDSLISGIGSKRMKIYEAIEYIQMSAGKLYDATIAGKLLESIALYPVGLKVVTSEGEIGVVVRQNPEATDRPVLRMLVKKDGSEFEKELYKDLMKIFTLFIVDTIE